MSCNVHPSPLSLAPCAAENVAAYLDCDNNTAKVSWSSDDVGNSYMVSAVGNHGYLASCESDEQMCYLTELQCGETYNVSLTTISEHCQTETHADVTFSTRELSNISSQSSLNPVNEITDTKLNMLSRAL